MNACIRSNTTDTFILIKAVHLVRLNGVVLFGVTGGLATNSSDEDLSVKEGPTLEWDDSTVTSCSHPSISAVAGLY